MLEVLLGEELRNVAVVVTRYFGGTLLGTGGLVRAYTQAVKEGLKASRTAVMRYGVKAVIETDYNGVGKILYLLGEYGLEPLESIYAEGVTLTVLSPYEEYARLCKDITEATNGKAILEEKDRLYYIDKKERV